MEACFFGTWEYGIKQCFWIRFCWNITADGCTIAKRRTILGQTSYSLSTNETLSNCVLRHQGHWSYSLTRKVHYDPVQETKWDPWCFCTTLVFLSKHQKENGQYSFGMLFIAYFFTTMACTMCLLATSMAGPPWQNSEPDQRKFVGPWSPPIQSCQIFEQLRGTCAYPFDWTFSPFLHPLQGRTNESVEGSSAVLVWNVQLLMGRCCAMLRVKAHVFTLNWTFPPTLLEAVVQLHLHLRVYLRVSQEQLGPRAAWGCC